MKESAKTKASTTPAGPAEDLAEFKTLFEGNRSQGCRDVNCDQFPETGWENETAAGPYPWKDRWNTGKKLNSEIFRSEHIRTCR